MRAGIGLKERVSDNAFGLALQKVDWCAVRRCLHRHIKAEKRREAPKAPFSHPPVQEHRGHTNEWTTIELTLGALLSAYGRTNLIERVTASDEKSSVGNRYFVSSEDADELSAQEVLELAAHALRQARPGRDLAPKNAPAAVGERG